MDKDMQDLEEFIANLKCAFYCERDSHRRLASSQLLVAYTSLLLALEESLERERILNRELGEMLLQETDDDKPL